MLNVDEAQELHGSIGEALDICIREALEDLRRMDSHMRGVISSLEEAKERLRRALELASIVVSDAERVNDDERNYAQEMEAQEK